MVRTFERLLRAGTPARNFRLLRTCLPATARHAQVLRDLAASKGQELGAPAAASGALAECSTDLTAKAREGKLDPLIGREDEVERRGQILLLSGSTGVQH